MSEIYAAREKNAYQISSRSIVAKIKENDETKEAHFFNNFESIVNFVLDNAEDGDLVITMGAGDIYKVGELILEADRESFLK
jgi:UDP-N-acetylmuramate--alanine ligase